MKTGYQPPIFVVVCFVQMFVMANVVEAQFVENACNQHRLRSLSKMAEMAKEIKLADFEIRVRELQLEILRIKREAEIIPLTVSVAGKSSHTSEISNEFWDKDYGESVEVNTTYDLNFWKQKLKTQIQATQIQIYEAELQSLLNEELQSKLLALVDIAESDVLSRILKHQISLYNEKLNYFMQLQEGGSKQLAKMSEVKIKIAEAQDKITANEIKLNQKLSYIGMEANDMPRSEIITNFNVPEFETTCNYSPSEIKKLSAELELIRLEDVSHDYVNKIDLSVGVSLSQRRTHLGHNNEAQVALSGKLPLYEGGKGSVDKFVSAQSKSLKSKSIARAREDLESLLDQRPSSEKVFMASINNLETQIAEASILVRELEARKQMGQSVFMEFTDKKIEKLKLMEVQLRLQSDFLQDWVQFLRKVNGFRHP